MDRHRESAGSAVASSGGRTRALVVGGGPAGLGAAMEASQAGLNVVVVDEEHRLGGQYFRGAKNLASIGAPRWYQPPLGTVEHRLGTAVVDVRDPRSLQTWSEVAGLQEERADAVILATGAHDRPAPIPGWTLPGVFTAGGALTLAKAYRVAVGHRVAVSGAGPSTLQVASELLRLGSKVTVLEAASLRVSASGAGSLMRDLATLRHSAALVTDLVRRRVTPRFGEMVTRIGGIDRVEWVDVSPVDAAWRAIPGAARRLPADAVALGFGFVPRTELASLMGCRLVVDAVSVVLRVAVDERQRTSVLGVYAAGEVAGLSGARVAVLQGRLAAATAAYDLGSLDPDSYAARVRDLQGRLRAAQRTAGWLARAFAPRPGLFEMIGPDDIVCRCEEVTRSQVDEALAIMTSSPVRLRAVKAATRCGMGRCQGRMCSPTLLALASKVYGGIADPGGLPWTPRPPLRPVPLGVLAGWVPPLPPPARQGRSANADRRLGPEDHRPGSSLGAAL